MKALLVIAFTFLCLSLGEKTRYDNYQVLRVSLNDSSAEAFFSLADKLELDVWASNRIHGWADVMVPPTRTSVFDRYFPYEVRIENVQTTLDEHYEDMRNAQSRGRNSTFAFDYFPPYPDLVDWIDEIEAGSNGRAQKISIGSTYQGNQILALRMGNPNGPVFFMYCGIHAREWITITTCAYIIEQLLGEDDDGTEILSHFLVFIVPVLNVDGYIFTHNSNRLWRKDREPNPGSTCIGTDMNRNYGAGWGGPGSSPSACADTYRGSSAYSSWGIFYLVQFVRQFSGRLALFVDLHAYGAMWMCPWGSTNNLPPAQDYNPMYEEMGNACNDVYDVNGNMYDYGSVANVIYLASGGSNDDMYAENGCKSPYAVEVTGGNFTPPISQILPIAREIWAGIKRILLNKIRNP